MSDLLNNAPLHWPEAREWMWTYCIYLGPFTDRRGRNYDLGIYLSPAEDYRSPHDIDRVSAAIVYGPEDGNYISGPLYYGTSEAHNETISRAKTLGLIE